VISAAPIQVGQCAEITNQQREVVFKSGNCTQGKPLRYIPNENGNGGVWRREQ
jgi:hypothetical protein